LLLPSPPQFLLVLLLLLEGLHVLLVPSTLPLLLPFRRPICLKHFVRKHPPVDAAATAAIWP
jgi:hypothetical protein